MRGPLSCDICAAAVLIVVPSSGSPMASAPFWLALISQLVIVTGYFWFYRKEQLCTFLSYHQEEDNADQLLQPDLDHGFESQEHITRSHTAIRRVVYIFFLIGHTIFRSRL